MFDASFFAIIKKYVNSVALGAGAVQIPGPAGQNIELRNDGTNIQWRVVGATTWNNLVAVSALKGDDGEDGIDGKDGVDGQDGADGETPELRSYDGKVQYRFPTQQPSAWTDLFTIPTSGIGGGYEPPVGGIPKEDLAQDVQDLLDKAGTALQDGDEFSGDYDDLDNIPTEFPPEAHGHLLKDITDFDPDDYATKAQGELADSALQSSDLSAHNSSNLAHNDIRTLIDNLQFVKNVEYSSASGDVTFTYKDNSTLKVNVFVENLAKDIDYDPATHKLVITKQDGTEIKVDVSDLIDVYTGFEGTHIQVTVSNNEIHAVLKAGTVTETELSTALLAKINGKLDATAQAVDSNKLNGQTADYYAKQSDLITKQDKLRAGTAGFLRTESGTAGQEGTPVSPYSFMRNISGLTAGVNGTLLDTVNAATANAVAGQGNTITLFSIAGADWTAFTDLPADLTGLSTTSYLRVLANRLNTNQVEVIINIWGNNNQYKRSTYSNGTWAGSWVKLATTADLDNFAGVNRTLISTTTFTTLLDLMKDQQQGVGVKTVFLTNTAFNALTDIPTDITFSNEYKTATIIRGATNNITIEVTTWSAGSNYTWRRTTINDGTWGTSVWKRLATTADIQITLGTIDINCNFNDPKYMNNGKWGGSITNSTNGPADLGTVYAILETSRVNNGAGQYLVQKLYVLIAAGQFYYRILNVDSAGTILGDNPWYKVNNTNPVFSTTEVNTGKTWTDGKPIYRKAFTYTDSNPNIAIGATKQYNATTYLGVNIFSVITQQISVAVAHMSDLNPIGSSPTAGGNVRADNAVSHSIVSSNGLILIRNGSGEIFDSSYAVTISGWIEYTKA